MDMMQGIKAIANPTRLRVLELLKDPAARQELITSHGSVKGLTASALLQHLRISQPTLTEHMEILLNVGLVESVRSGRWVVYTRDEERIRQLKQTIIDQLLP